VAGAVRNFSLLSSHLKDAFITPIGLVITQDTLALAIHDYAFDEIEGLGRAMGKGLVDGHVVGEIGTLVMLAATKARSQRNVLRGFICAVKMKRLRPG